MNRFRTEETIASGGARFPVAPLTPRFRGVLGIRELKPAIGDGARRTNEDDDGGVKVSETGHSFSDKQS